MVVLRASFRPLVVLVALCLGRAPAMAQSPDGNGGREAARPIAAAAMAAYDARNYVAAITGFTQADSLYPTPQYKVYIARANKWLGKVASAARAYQAAASMQPTADSPRDFASVQATAASEFADIRLRIPIVAIQIVGVSSGEAHVTLDGEPIPGHLLERLEVDPGDHTIQASAPGFAPATAHLQIVESTFTPLSLTLEKASAAPLLPGLAPPFRGGPSPTNRDPEVPPPNIISTYSHRWKPGILLRGDIDPIGGGVLFAPGLSLGLFDHLEIGVSALIGGSVGVEPLVRGFFLSGSWKPLIEVAAPIFIVDGGRPGIRGAAGIQWDFHRHFGAFVTMGGAYFPEPPPRYQTAYFLPSFGLQGRL